MSFLGKIHFRLRTITQRGKSSVTKRPRYSTKDLKITSESIDQTDSEEQ